MTTEISVNSEENSALVHEFVITDNLRKVVTRSLDEISASKTLLQRLYAAATYVILSEVCADIYALRREMSRRKLRIVSEEAAQGTLIVRYTVRNSAGIDEEKTELQREELRREIGLRLARRMKAMEMRVSKAEKENATQP
ncbi:hypothetical protein [Paenibacillus sp. YN15]|uniref:hypothetical protein n=1 Tax=Paenibacillus sp. YN15 TaxID=1742774 RepID=UPI000DCF3D17|nr:hypothetical protein [Paenibacillus sp. YN15]RAU96780.1 hypothetical protein DQG13_19670 [Paenibacillus sp. YN15]